MKWQWRSFLLLLAIILGIKSFGADGATTTQEVVDMGISVLDANTSAAERKPLPQLNKQNNGWLARISKISTRAIGYVTWPFVLLFFRRRDRLRENLLDDQSKEEYDLIRLQYIAMAKDQFKNDPVVDYIVTGKNAELHKVLKEGLRDTEMLHPYFDIAEMMPNEGALYMLTRELDYRTSNSPDLLKKLREIDYISILANLITPHLRPDCFKRLFTSHPPENQTKFLTDVLESVAQSTSEIFVEYVAACYDLALRSRTSARSILLEFYNKRNLSNRPPLNIAMGLFYISLENHKGKNDFMRGIELLKDIEFEEGSVVLLRGLNSVVEQSHAMTKLATGSKMWLQRLDVIARLALKYDPSMSTVVNEKLIGILDLYRIMQAWRDRAGLKSNLSIQIEENMTSLLKRKLSSLPLSILSFVLRTNLVMMKDIRNDSLGLFPSWDKYQTTLISLIEFLQSLPLANLIPCSKRSHGEHEITHIAVGHILDTKLFASIGFVDAQTLIYTTLSTIYRVPPSAFIVDRPLGHLGPLAHLNRRMNSYCEGTHPLISFEENPLRDDYYWVTWENLRLKRKQRPFHRRKSASRSKMIKNDMLEPETEKDLEISSPALTNADPKSPQARVEKRASKLPQATSIVMTRSYGNKTQNKPMDHVSKRKSPMTEGKMSKGTNQHKISGKDKP